MTEAVIPVNPDPSPKNDPVKEPVCEPEKEPEIILLVNVCDPVSVTITVSSTATSAVDDPS